MNFHVICRARAAEGNQLDSSLPTLPELQNRSNKVRVQGPPGKPRAGFFAPAPWLALPGAALRLRAARTVFSLTPCLGAMSRLEPGVGPVLIPARRCACFDGADFSAPSFGIHSASSATQVPWGICGRGCSVTRPCENRVRCCRMAGHRSRAGLNSIYSRILAVRRLESIFDQPRGILHDLGGPCRSTSAGTHARMAATRAVTPTIFMTRVRL